MNTVENADNATDDAPEAAAAEAPAETEQTAAEPTEEAAPEAEPEDAGAPTNGSDGPVELPDLFTNEEMEAWITGAVAAEGIIAQLVTGTITEITDDKVTVDLGEDGSDTIDRDEFVGADGSLSAEVGAEVEVYVEDVRHDGPRLSYEKAQKLSVWQRIETVAKGGTIEGRISGKVKGGLSVDVGVKAFLPGSQLELRPSRNIERFIGKTFDFEIIKFNKKRGNVVLSRRAALEKERAELKEVTLQKLEVGAIMDGVVKNLTDYGAFVDLGGIDGLLHVTDMSYKRVGHPSEMINIGDTVRVHHPKHIVKSGQEIRVQVLAWDPANEKISLGMKQITTDPWLEVDRRFREGQRIDGKVLNMTDYGAFVEIEDGVEGLIHVSEMSWTKRVNHPKDVLKKGQEIEAVIVGIDEGQRRISLSLKQTMPNPWTELEGRYPVGTRINAKIKSVTNFGVFLGVEDGIDGLVHVSDLAWGGGIKDPREHYQTGQELEAVILDIDADNERLSLGVKQLSQDPWADVGERFPIGSVVTGKVTKLLEFGAIVQVADLIEGLIHISELSEDRVESVGDIVKVDQEVEARVISLTPEQRKMGLSIKRLSEDNDVGSYAAEQPATRTTIGDLIKEKIDIDSLPPGPAGDDEG